MHEFAIGPWRTLKRCEPMSAFGGKADIIQRLADIKKCPLMTQSGLLFPIALATMSPRTVAREPISLITNL